MVNQRFAFANPRFTAGSGFLAVLVKIKDKSKWVNTHTKMSIST